MATSGSAGLSPSLARNRNYALLLSGQFVSQMGDRLAMVAIPWLVYTSTGSALSTGIALALYTLPYVLFGAVAGALIDHFDKRLVMVTADVVRAALVLALPFVGERSTAGIYALTFLVATATVFFDPSMLSLLPDIVPEDRLLRANSLLSSSATITEIVGYSLAGFIVYYFAIRTSFSIDAATFCVSALTLMALRQSTAATRERETVPSPRIEPTLVGATTVFDASGSDGAGAAGGEAARRPPPESRPRLLVEVREGLSFLLGHAGLRANTILTVAAALGVGAVYPLSFLLAVREFNGTRAFGFMEAAIAVGYLGGSIIMAVLASRVRKGLGITIGLAVMGAGYCLVWAFAPLWAILVLFALLGAANATALISIDTYFQETIPKALRGRVWGTRFTLTQGSYAFGVLFGGALAASFAVRPLFVVFGAIILVPAVIGLFVPRVRDI